MNSFVLQDWITVRGDISVSSIAQGENDVFGVAPFQDAVFWLEIRALTNGGANAPAVYLAYETSPSKDESLFVPMVAAFDMTSVFTGSPPAANPQVTKVLLSQNPDCPLGRWVRWRITVPGTISQTWDATFRILVCCNAAGSANVAQL